MADYEVVCHGCGDTFSAGSPRAKWCSHRCRMRKQRHPDSSVDEPEEKTEGTGTAEDSGLTATVRQELQTAGRLDTFYGRLAVTLASRLSKPDETGVSSLSKELRLVMEAALSGVKPPEPVEEEMDEVELARRRRQEMADRARRSAEQG